ncbi:MAG: methyl-accepting chemotaxis protein [Bacteroidota bacterium]|nr:methyl-accepting chemotaxis protein [Bacteroidota bacterium]
MKFKVPKYLRTKKLKYRIMVPVILVTSVFYFIALGYIINKMYNTGLDQTKKYIDAVAIQNADKLGREMVRYYNISSSAAALMEHVSLTDSTQMFAADENILRTLLKENSDFFSFWLSRQFFSYKSNWAPEYGRKRLTAYFSKVDETVDVQKYYLDKTGESGLYKDIHEQRKEVVIEPYYDAVGILDSVWMTSICVPIEKNNEFIGLVGIDITLERITDLVYNIEPYMESNAFLISGEGKYVAHENKDYLGKSLTDVQKNTGDLKAKLGKSENFSFIDSKGGNSYYVSFAAVEMGVSDSKPWMLAVAVPISNITKESVDSVINAFIIGVLGLFFIVFIIFRISYSITKPIKRAILFAEQISKGNLTAELKVKGRDEVAELASYLDVMRAKIRAIIEQVQSTSIALADSSDFLKEASGKLTENANEQSSSAEEISASMEVMVTNIEENFENSKKTKDISDAAANGIKNSKEKVVSSEKLITTIADKIKVINDIAFQVHILSLNTAIEAAHAGKYGKGFTTIASEIRSLAVKSQEAADEIIKLSENSVEITRQSSESLQQIAPKVIESSELMTEVSVAGQEQKMGAGQINGAISSLNDIVQQNSSYAVSIADRASKLKSEVVELNQLIVIFKTD